MGRKNTNGLKRIVNRAVHGTMLETAKAAAGEEALPVVGYLQGKQNISEFEIASNIREEVGWVRQMLYRLQNKNLVTYFRKKDRIKGWYISYWTLNKEGARHLAVRMTRDRVEDLRERIVREEKYKGLFYICPGLCTRLVFEEATEVDFKCPECGTVLQHQDNRKTIERLKQRIAELEKKRQ